MGSHRDAPQQVQQSSIGAPEMLDLLPIGVMLCDLEGIVGSVNRAACELLGTELIGESCWDVIEVHGGSHSLVDRAMRAVAAGRAGVMESHGIAYRAHGVRMPVAVAVRCTPGDRSMVLVTVRQLGEELRQAARLRAWEDRFEQLATSVPAGILSSEYGMRVDFVNDRCIEIFATPAEDLLGFGWLELVDPDDAVAAENAIAEALSAGRPRRLPLRIAPRQGSARQAWVRIRPVSTGGRDTGFVATIEDVTEANDASEALVAQALCDPLTGLANRTALWEQLGDALREHSGHPAVLFIDLDDFKNVNDSLGHTAGDELLVVMAERLRSCARASDLVVRFGGDEFVLLLRDVPDRGVVDAVARRVLSAVRKPVGLAGQDTVVTASIGIVWPEGHERSGDLDVESFVRDADIALYEAKRKGKNRAENLDAELRDGTQRRIGIGAELRRAVESDSGDLGVHFQPIIEMGGGRLVGFEALARWNHPELGPVPPGDFISVAEETGLITPLARRILDRALAPMARWRAAPGAGHLFVSVNMSARDLGEPRLASYVAEALASCGLPGDALHLELTESAVMTDPGAAQGVLVAMKELGTSIAIDDFGTGYSSLAYLHRLPVDTIKIDREFVAALEHDNTAVVEAIVALARALGLTVVAEGVETQEQATILGEIGVPLAQGYLFSHPLAAADVDPLLARLSL